MGFVKEEKWSNLAEITRNRGAMAPNTAMLLLTLHTCNQVSVDAHAAGIRDVISKSDNIADRLMASLSNMGAAG